MIVILGAGLAGLSCSYHIGHDRCVLLEMKPYPFGHIHSEVRYGFTWDEGPHVSFTAHDYVRDLFSRSVNGKFEEYPVRTVNYFHGHWIDHPAQSNLFQVPEPLRQRCLDDFLASRASAAAAPAPGDYRQWLEQAFGATFAETFPAAYTRKYWTRDPSQLTTAWVGPRVFYPEVDDVLGGANGPLTKQTHYIKNVRYPRRGGYQSFARGLAVGADIRTGSTVTRVDLRARVVTTADGETWPFTRLINTLPLPTFIQCCEDAPNAVRAASEALACSELLLVNVTAPHPTRQPGNWFYIYDEDKLATRINCTEVLSPHNAPEGQTGVQVEVYASKARPFPDSRERIAATVVQELVEMGFIDESAVAEGRTYVHTHSVPWANVIFDHARESALDTVLGWLAEHGLTRDEDDLAPACDWSRPRAIAAGPLALAGRFGQWKYFWTDDCVLRGRELAGQGPGDS